jgi:hypothetical protein
MPSAPLPPSRAVCLVSSRASIGHGVPPGELGVGPDWTYPPLPTTAHVGAPGQQLRRPARRGSPEPQVPQPPRVPERLRQPRRADHPEVADTAVACGITGVSAVPAGVLLFIVEISPA